MIEMPIEFENQFIEKFGNIDRTTLHALSDQKLRFELGGDEVESMRVTQAMDRSNKILNYCFGGLPIWLRIILWDKEATLNLTVAGMDLRSAEKTLRDPTKDDLLYLYFEMYSFVKVSPIITSIINYDLGQDPSANITCYFVNFDKAIIANIYDDRGMDVYSLDKRIIDDLSNKFASWMI